jgi:manganese efflux pump family protein
MLSAVVLALALAMDATAVAAARGAADAATGARGRARAREAVILATLFGAFQAGMAAAGWLAGDAIGDAMARWDHWIAFVLLGGLGARMIVGALRSGKDDDADDDAGTRAGAALYLALAVATSIDAAAAGITLPLMAAPPGLTLALIGGITAALTAAGYALGGRIGARFGARAELIGGAVLIAVGTKILVEHVLA